MDFQVSALKWRPQKFSQLVGQEHIVRTLSNAISFERVGHAYLFSGTRGVGKTTTARIFAKALNCNNSSTPEPCDDCSFCEEIRQGNCVDVIEIDGASNNGIAEIRDLIENVQYASSACRYKIYIIDEVHMLSRSAFNALLKTLEEPPSHVVFIFATTELLKIPETILSRCQCFEFKPMTRGQVIKQLSLICDQEGIVTDAASLEQIAKNGGGSMRDSQSLLDQVIAFSGKEMEIGSVESVLGVVDRNVLKCFIDYLANRDVGTLIGQVQEVITAGKDPVLFCRDLIEYVRNLFLFKISNKSQSLLDPQLCDFDALRKQAERFHVDELHQMFTVLSRTEADMKRSTLPQILFEMSILRLTDIRPFWAVDEMIDKISQMEDDTLRQFIPTTQLLKEESSVTREIQESKNVSLSSESSEDALTIPQSDGEAGKNVFYGKDVNSLWEKVRAEIYLKKSSFRHFFEHCKVSVKPPATFRLDFRDPFTFGLVDKEENRGVIMETVKSVFGERVELELGITENVNLEEKKPTFHSPTMQKKKSYNDDEYYRTETQIIQDALDIFDGTVIR